MATQYPDASATMAAAQLSASALLDELKRIAVEQLGAVPSGLYRPIEAQLHDAMRAGHAGASRNDLMQVLALRQRSAAQVMRFRELIAAGFDDLRGRIGQGGRDVPLGLVAETELEFHVSGQRLAESIGSHFQQPLALLDKRFEMLAHALGVSPGNPVGASRLAGAFLRVFHDADISQSLQPLLFGQFEQELAKVLGDLYDRFNALLLAHGFDAIPASATPSPFSAQTPAMGGSRAQAPIPASTSTPTPTLTPTLAPAPALRLDPEHFDPGTLTGRGNADAFRASAGSRVEHQRLRDLLHAWRDESREQDRGAINLGASRDLRVQELVSVVSLMQDDAVKPLHRALVEKRGLNNAIREQLIDGAGRLGLDPGQMRLGEREEDAVDLVGLMFEKLLDSHSMVEQTRRMFVRLVMSYVKVALTDENLFVRPDHPARRLLDTLAMSCEGNEGATPQDRELLQRASSLVDRVVAEYNEDLAVFELTANELQDLLQQQRRRAQVVERRSAETVHGRERLMQARLQAAAVLGQRIAAQPLTRTVAHFLENHWQHHLVQVLLREGHESEHFGRVVRLGDDLIEADGAAARAEGGSVAERILALHDALVECLSSSGLDAQVAGEWMAGLARTFAFPDTVRERRPLPATQQISDDGDDTRLLAAVGGNGGLDYAEADAGRICALAAGTWLRLVDEDGQEGSVKIAWVSPLTSRLLLVNRRGIRKLVASPQQLAALLKAGRLSIEAEELPFDDAMRQVRQQLSGAVGRAA